MCGVVGYIGKNLCKDLVIAGLERFEYRGYDSAGFACIDPEDNRLLYSKAEGRLSNLTKKLEESPIDGFLGIGHTRSDSDDRTQQAQQGSQQSPYCSESTRYLRHHRSFSY